MEKLFNQFVETCDKKISEATRVCFPVLKILVGILNGIIGILGITMLFATVFFYIIPPLHLFIDSLKHIFNSHSIFASLIVVSIIIIIISLCGLYFLYRNEYERLGLQGASYLILLIIMIAIIFTFWVEWQANAHFGISYATQIYDPSKTHSKYYEIIQKFLRCCGAKGPTDFDIGNEYFKFGTVPISCCNFQENPLVCSQMKSLKNNGKGSLAINVKYAFQTGCLTRLEKIVWPSIVVVILCQSSLAIICMILTTILCASSDLYSKDSTKGSKNVNDPPSMYENVSESKNIKLTSNLVE